VISKKPKLPETLSVVFPREQARCRGLLVRYALAGDTGRGPSIQIEAALRVADFNAITANIVGIVASLKEMQSFK